MPAPPPPTARPDFPRPDDGAGHAWVLSGAAPTLVSERLSVAYEQQAADLWDAFAARGWIPALEWAGSQDGEAIIGRDAAGEIVCLFHLEEPAGAEELAAARHAGTLQKLIDAEVAGLAGPEDAW